MTRFDAEELKKLAALCRIECSEEEQKTFHANLLRVLGYVKLLEEVDTEEVSPCDRVLETEQNVFREDVVGETLSRDLFLSNAPAHVSGMIRVPPIISK